MSLLSVFVSSQYDGGNINKEQWLRFLPKPKKAKVNIMRRRLSQDLNIQHLDPTTHIPRFDMYTDSYLG